MSENTELTVFNKIDKEEIKTQIYEVRGIKVMLDSDIASYYGVETGALNRAMKRNKKRFPISFCFQLTREEYYEILRCQSGTLELEQGKYSKYLPYVYSEQGVAMLTSALHTDQAISASIQIMEAFVELTHYVRQNRQLLPYEELKSLELRQNQLANRVQNIEANMVNKSDLVDLMKLFETGISSEEVLILDGEPFKADIAYQKIYKLAKNNIIVVDDYLGVKTLHHLSHAKTTVDITIISDNKGKTPLRLSEYNDYITEYPGRIVKFVKSANRAHDRYIILDYGTNNMRVYHCGASSKDAGKKITTITAIKEVDIYKDTIKSLLTNPLLILN